MSNILNNISVLYNKEIVHALKHTIHQDVKTQHGSQVLRNLLKFLFVVIEIARWQVFSEE